MTMHEMTHPDDERLAALAGADPDATVDAALRAHVERCIRCTALVADLASLRTALAELPDMPPPRPLQLVPPVPAADAPRVPWFRRLVAPALGLGGVMVLVGAVGLAGGGLAANSAGLSGGEGERANLTADRTIWDALFGAGAADAAATERGAPEDTSGDDNPPALGEATPPADPAGPAAPSSSEAPGVSDEGAASAGGGWPGWPALPLILLGGGLALLGGGLAIRYVIAPRAG